MDAHASWVGDQCLACHLTNGPGDVLTNDSAEPAVGDPVRKGTMTIQ